MTEITDLNEKTRAAWNANAAFWDGRMADGNDFQRQLVGPSTERLLQLEPGELVLEAACGNGVMARRLAELGGRVVAFDFAPNMIDAAKDRGTADGAIEYHVADATRENEILALGAGRFDAAVCNMAIMDMAEIEPLLDSMPKMLKANGRFVFSLCHPCFNHQGTARAVEEIDDGGIVSNHSVRVFRYVSSRPSMGLAMTGQPELQVYFDRTLTQLFEPCFAAGLVITGIEEPVFQEEGTRSNWIHWDLFKEIPPVLVVRTEIRR